MKATDTETGAAAPGAVTSILAKYVPAMSEVGLTRTLKPVPVFPVVGVTISQGAAGVTVAVKSRAAPDPLRFTVTVCAAGNCVAPIWKVKVSDVGVRLSVGCVCARAVRHQTAIPAIAKPMCRHIQPGNRRTHAGAILHHGLYHSEKSGTICGPAWSRPVLPETRSSRKAAEMHLPAIPDVSSDSGWPTGAGRCRRRCHSRFHADTASWYR